MARFLIDENLPHSLADLLRTHGIDAVHVRDVGLVGADDAAVFAHAVANGRAIVTLDVGLGDITKYPLGTHAGIVLARFVTSLHRDELNKAIAAALRLLPDEDLAGNVVVYSPHKLRIHRKP
jgi:predicted nuclease of predicted toxin-antitoxin system